MMSRTSPSAASKAGLLGSLRRSTQDRPFLKLCEKCKGKGQLSYFNNQQVKVYSACDDCSKGEENALFSLGVKLKCTCAKESATYMWMHASQVRGTNNPSEFKALTALQADLQYAGNALLLNCTCGAKYLCIDGPQRRKVSGKKELNAEDKKYNREVAETLIRNGIHRILQPGPERYL